MQKNKSYLKIKTPVALVFLALLTLTSIASGYLYANKGGQVAGAKSTAKATTNLKIDKVDTPELKFFVMSFCPYGNQIETALKPVADLLGDKANIQPQYIFDKIDGDLANYCKQKVPDATRCQDYVDAGQVASVSGSKPIKTSERSALGIKQKTNQFGGNLLRLLTQTAPPKTPTPVGKIKLVRLA